MSTIEGGDMGKAPAFQFYASDFNDGTDYMTAAEVGIYIRLLASSWTKGPLPTDLPRLASIARVTVKEFTAAWESSVSSKWTRTPAGFVNDRLEEQRHTQQAFSKEQAEKGKAGAKKRWQRPSSGHSRGHAPAIAEPMAQAIPDDGSSVFDLQSSPPLTIEQSEGRERPRARGHAGVGLMAPHPHCDPFAALACARNYCVPKFLYQGWRRQVDADSPHSPAVDAYIKAVVVKGLEKLPASGPIGGVKAAAFWERHWADEHASRAPAQPPQATKPGKVGGIFAAAREVIAKQEAFQRQQKAVGDGSER